MNKTTSEQLLESASHQFITLTQGPVFVLAWTGGTYGPDYSQLKVGDLPLDQFLDGIGAELIKLQKELNQLFKKINREDPVNGVNRPIFARFMEAATWAMHQASLLNPLLKHYRACPTNFLYVDWVFRLEEVYTKCLAVIYIFGMDGERSAAYASLLHDFVHMGGISKDGGPGNGLETSMMAYYMAFFSSTNRHPMVYHRFGEFVEKLGDLVCQEYPKAAAQLASSIDYRLRSDTHGFAFSAITSPAKTAMLEVLRHSVETLRAAKQKVA